MSKKIVLSGYFGFKNFGDEEILSVLINKIQQCSYDQITVISSDPEYTEKQYPKIQSIYTFSFKEIILKIAQCDLLISGGGSLLQDVTSKKSLYYYLFIILFAIIMRKKVIIFAQGIGPIKSKLGQAITKFILRKCQYISVRDKKSAELLTTWGLNSQLVCDPIFTTQITETEKENTVVIQLRNFKTMNEDFIDRLAQKVNENFGDKAIEVLSFQNNIDTPICEKFVQSLRLLNSSLKIELHKNLTNKEIIEKISKSQYLIGMRFHSIIIGILSKCRVLAINYDIKVEKLAKEFDIPIIDLKTDFGTKFKDLQTQNPETRYQKAKQYNFDWSKFEEIINK